MISPLERFWKHVNKNGSVPDVCPELGPCWNWIGAAAPKNWPYGHFTVSKKTVDAHRFSYEQFVGPIGNKWVLHHCDNTRCVNPEHLFLGTHKDNMRDALKKGRLRHGENHYHHKLSEVQIKSAVLYRKNGWTLNKIADRFLVHPHTIAYIFRGLRWKHLNLAGV
jgi:hypothetical protein